MESALLSRRTFWGWDILTGALMVGLVVLIIITVGYQDRVAAEKNLARSRMLELAEAEEMYLARNGKYTRSLTELLKLDPEIVPRCPTSGLYFDISLSKEGEYTITSPVPSLEYGEIVRGDPSW
jgi:hypothetical protein